MSQEIIRVVARITAHAGKEKALEHVLTALLAPTRAEAGCISYQLLLNQDDTTDFTFIEQWRSNTAIDEHFGTTHLQQALTDAAEFMACAPDIRRYRLIA